MGFFFGGNKKDNLSHKIRMREIDSVAKKWDHPMKGLYQCAKEVSSDGNILSLQKRTREKYCLSILSLAVMDESGFDWWVSIPDIDPPDGFIGTFTEGPDGYTGLMREVEVVEHRSESINLGQTIKDKMTKKSYGSNTILACLVLSPGFYDFQELANELGQIDSRLDHIFVVFTGALFNDIQANDIDLKTTYSVVQLKPTFETHTFSYLPYLDDYNDRYNKGQESRLIEGDSMFFGTSNPDFAK